MNLILRGTFLKKSFSQTLFKKLWSKRSRWSLEEPVPANEMSQQAVLGFWSLISEQKFLGGV